VGELFGAQGLEQPVDMKRVLVVDDDDELAGLLALALYRAGYEVEVASSAIAALEHVRRAPFDVLLVDWNMPVGGGAAFLREWRRGADKDTPPVVVMSGAPDALERALQLGAAAVIAKPFRLDELETLLLRVLDGQRH
jgi:DNA-binding response OmpR family regulator